MTVPMIEPEVLLTGSHTIERCEEVTEAGLRATYAAMAAHNAPVEQLWHSLTLLVGRADWPSDALHTTAVDCYTGERIVCSHQSGVPVTHAVSASMSVDSTTPTTSRVGAWTPSAIPWDVWSALAGARRTSATASVA